MSRLLHAHFTISPVTPVIGLWSMVSRTRLLGRTWALHWLLCIPLTPVKYAGRSQGRAAVDARFS